MANNNFNSNLISNFCWMREIQVILTSDLMKKTVTFDNNYKISISGTKYLSALKDTFTISIDNIPYDKQVQLIAGKYFNVEIKAGYRTSGLHTVYKGYVLYMSNNLGDKKTTTFVILCASKMVALYGQSRMNLSLKSGINMYSALNYIFKKAGITNAKIDENFKNRVLQECVSISSTATSYIDSFINSNQSVANTDASFGNAISVWSPLGKDARLIKLSKDNILLTGSYPTLDSDGLSIDCIPNITYLPGDTIELDNSIINVYANSSSTVYDNATQYMDENGRYIIYQITYRLNNRSSSFMTTLLCKKRSSVLSSLIGGSSK